MRWSRVLADGDLHCLGRSTEQHVNDNPLTTDRLDADKIHYADVDGIRTRYYEDGTGQAIVLLHGGHFDSLDSLDSWSLSFPELSKHFHVYALDKLGMGYTDPPLRDADYTYEALFQHILGFVANLGITKANFVGHSRGGLPVAHLALERPDLINKAVIVDSNTAAADHPSFPTWQFYVNYRAHAPSGQPTTESVRGELEAQSHSTEHITEDFVARMLEIARLPQHQEVQRRMESLTASVWNPSLSRKRAEILRGIDERGLAVPTMIVWGVNDPSAPLPLAYQLYERIAVKTPSAELHVMNRAGHYSYREQPAAFNGMLKGFL